MKIHKGFCALPAFMLSVSVLNDVSLIFSMDEFKFRINASRLVSPIPGISSTENVYLIFTSQRSVKNSVTSVASSEFW